MRNEAKMTPDITNAFVFFILVFFTIAIAGFYWHLHQESLDRAVERHLKVTRLYPDHLGNKPSLISDTGHEKITSPRPGNSPNPPTETYLLSPVTGEVKRAKPAPPLKINNPSDMSVTIYPRNEDGSININSTAQPIRLEQPEQRLQLEQPEQLGSEQDEHTLLAMAKGRGEGKIKSIETICGIKRGASKDYEYWSQAWDSLPGGVETKKYV
jgi:hypothetical protein